MHRKIRINTGETGNEVAFPNVDGFFGRIGAVNVWRGELQCGAGVLDVIFEASGAFVIKNVQ